MPDSKKWLALVVLEDRGDTDVDGHRYHSAEEIRDIIESMDVVRGVKILSYTASTISGLEIVLGPRV